MNVVINGCGRVARALLKHWSQEELAPNVILMRSSTHQWRDDRGIDKELIIQYLANPGPFTEPRQSIDEILLQDIDFWFELTPTDLSIASEVHGDISKILRRGIPVIFANKAPLVYDYLSLKKLADSRQVHLGLSGVLGASLPSYALVHYGSLGAKILSMEGILNGTTNFILKQMEENISFDKAVALAQKLGIAEPNWAYDVDGFDSAIKMSLLASVISNKNISFDPSHVKGIRDIDLEEIQSLKKENKRIKLLATFEKDIIRVSPKVYTQEDIFHHIDGSDKILYIRTDKLSDMTLIGGKSGLTEVAASLHRDLLWIKELMGH